MPFKVYTSDNDRIVYLEFVDPWSAADMFATFQWQKAFCERLDHPIYLVADLRATHRIPPGVLRARESPLLKTSHLEQIIMVGGPAIARVLGDTVLKIAGSQKARFFAGNEEALQYLRESIAKESVGPVIPSI